MEKTYFASCNSFKGFRSYFDKIFNSRDFDKIFVLKGGPGTGKSTLMKKITKTFGKDEVNIENFYCSSDINSLDGVIVEKCEKRVAILDGTAPHERDATVVGSIDEIVNLGENLDCIWLEKYSDKILELSGQKSDAYKTAYSYLRCAGACDAEIVKEVKNVFDSFSARKYIHNLNFSSELAKEHNVTIRLISSFSKDGYQRRPITKSTNTKTIKIGGNSYAARILLNMINSSIYGEKLLSPHPLDTDYLDALYSAENDILFIIEGEKADINADDFTGQNAVTYEKNRMMKKLHDELLAEAKRWFGIASDIHFRLEEIYSRCMNFDKNDKIFDKICEKISKVCDIQV